MCEVLAAERRGERKRRMRKYERETGGKRDRKGEGMREGYVMCRVIRRKHLVLSFTESNENSVYIS